MIWRICSALTLVAGLSALAETAAARTINIEFLEGTVDTGRISALSGLACRNYDRIVRVRIAVDWPRDQVTAEAADYKRLVFWNAEAEYLFPNGSYSYQHGSYMVNGYFIVRSGGVHQGVVSVAFEKVDDAKVLLNPDVREVKAQGSKCP